jgi:DNA gyrase subunit B
LHHLVFEMLDDSVEEVFLGVCNHIWLTLAPNDVVSIRDNSRGLPIQIARDGKRLLEWIMTNVSRRRVGGEYEVTGGLHGVGLSAVNALCAECTVEVACDGFLWQQSYREGAPQSDVIQVRPLLAGESTGTTITFRPDFTILDRNPFNYDTLAERARELTHLLPELTITLRDERQDSVKQEEFHFPNGLADYVRGLNQGRRVWGNPLVASEEVTIQRDLKDPYRIRVDVALQYANTKKSTILGFVNTVKTSGGTHMEPVPFAVATHLRDKAHFSGEHPFSEEECIPGLKAVVSVRHPHPSYESAMRVELINQDVVGVVLSAVYNALSKSQDDHIFQKCRANRRALQKNPRIRGKVVKELWINQNW